ncbi:MAG: PTS sugar transporter subunit IIB [Desulfovibrionales bacterium]
MLVRIDNRLVHGQIIEAWVPHIQAKAIWVVNEDLARDEIRQEIMSLAIPHGVAIRFTLPSALAEEFKQEGFRDILVLFASCHDARDAFERGFKFSSINIANLHYSPGKTQICDHVAVSDEDVSCLSFFSRRGVDLDFRCVPNKPVQVRSIW